MVPVLDAARRHGILIIHAPSDTIDFYKDAPERKIAEAAPPISPPENRPVLEGPLPIDFADGGCDTSPPDKYYKAWTRENAIIPIAKEDLISTDGIEIYRNLKSRGIETVMYVGVHANICILKRSFALRQMRAWGVRCLLIRDLTDAMYNPHDAPYVSHEQGTELVIRHIERFLAPSLVSSDLLQALGH
jgi:nicotinamidase-related amidase